MEAFQVNGELHAVTITLDTTRVYLLDPVYVALQVCGLILELDDVAAFDNVGFRTARGWGSKSEGGKCCQSNESFLDSGHGGIEAVVMLEA